MGGISGPALYGTARALQDTETANQRAKSFESDQAIRAQQLEDDKTTGPLRRRALELGIDQSQQAIDTQKRLSPLQESAAALNVKIATMNQGQQEQFIADAATARTNRDHMLNGVREFTASGDPQAMTDALAKINPKFAEVKAKREADGSITLDGGQGRPMTFKAQKWPDGTEMSPDEALTIYAQKNLDPLKWVENEYQQKFGVAKEVAKQSAIGERQQALENARAPNRLAVAETAAAGRGAARTEAQTNRERSQIKPVLDSVLKTSGQGGSFALGYSSSGHDAALRPLYEEAMDEAVSDGTPARRAVRPVLTEVRGVFDKAMTKANQLAAPLLKKGINPRDDKAMQAAAQKGDPEVLAFTTFIKGFNERSGLGSYLLEQVKGPAK